jgi:uncharacterized membrane protein
MDLTKHSARYAVLALLFLLALSSRFINIGTQSIYVDETWVIPNTTFHFEDKSIFPKLFSYGPFLQLSPEKQELMRKVYDFHPLVQVAALHAVSDNHPPLFFMLNYYWGRWFGYGAGTVRTPAAIYAMLSFILLFFMLKRQNIGITQNIAILAFMILSPLFLFFSNWARPYTLLVLFSLLSFYLCFEIVRTSYDRKMVFLYLLSVLAMLYTHYYGVLVVTAQVAYLATESLLQSKKRQLLSVFGITLIAVLVFLPAAVIIVMKARHASAGPEQAAFTRINLPALTELWLSFGYAYSLSTLYSLLNIFVSTIQLLLFTAGFGYLFKNREQMVSRFWLFFFLYPFLMIVIFNTVLPMFTVRNCLILLVPYLAICGFGLCSLKWNFVRFSVSGFIGILGLVYVFHGLSYGNVKGPSAWEDWRSAGAYLQKTEKNLPVYVYHHSYLDALYYYLPDQRRLKGFPEDRTKQGIEDASYVLVVAKPEAPSFSIDKKISKELPFLSNTEKYTTIFLTEFPHIFIYRVNKINGMTKTIDGHTNLVAIVRIVLPIRTGKNNNHDSLA